MSNTRKPKSPMNAKRTPRLCGARHTKVVIQEIKISSLERVVKRSLLTFCTSALQQITRKLINDFDSLSKCGTESKNHSSTAEHTIVSVFFLEDQGFRMRSFFFVLASRSPANDDLSSTFCNDYWVSIQKKQLAKSPCLVPTTLEHFLGNSIVPEMQN